VVSLSNQIEGRVGVEEILEFESDWGRINEIERRKLCSLSG